jgi:hypothetical protein
VRWTADGRAAVGMGFWIFPVHSPCLRTSAGVEGSSIFRTLTDVYYVFLTNISHLPGAELFPPADVANTSKRNSVYVCQGAENGGSLDTGNSTPD